MEARVERRDLKEPSWASILLWVMGAIVVVFLLVGTAPWLIYNDSHSSAADFGSSFGAVNALFAALAFGGVIVALFMQRHELRLQRRELELQRKEFVLTRDEHHKTAVAQKEAADRMFLAAYLNALESLRQYCAWRLAFRREEPSRRQAHVLAVNRTTGDELERLVEALQGELSSVRADLAGSPTPVSAIFHRLGLICNALEDASIHRLDPAITADSAHPTPPAARDIVVGVLPSMRESAKYMPLVYQSLMYTAADTLEDAVREGQAKRFFRVVSDQCENLYSLMETIALG